MDYVSPNAENELPNERELSRLIGARIRELRKWRGYSQQDLAEAVKVTFQQFQKYGAT